MLFYLKQIKDNTKLEIKQRPSTQKRVFATQKCSSFLLQQFIKLISYRSILTKWIAVVLLAKHDAITFTMMLYLLLPLILLLSYIICTKIGSNHIMDSLLARPLSLFYNLALSSSFQKISNNIHAKLFIENNK